MSGVPSSFTVRSRSSNFSGTGQGKLAALRSQLDSYAIWVVVLLIALLFISVGMSVVAWKEMKELRGELLRLEAASHKGYQALSSGMDPIHVRISLLEAVIAEVKG